MMSRKPSKYEWDMYFRDHPRRQVVRSDYMRQSFVCNTTGKQFPGLTKNLPKLLWPNYEYGKGQRCESEEYTREKNQTQKQREEQEDCQISGEVYSARSLSDGMNRGTEMHRQLRMYMRNPVKYIRDVKESLRNGGPDLYKTVKYGIAILGLNDLIPMLAEVPVCDEQNNLATAIDGICYITTSGQLALVEWKTGYTGCFEKGTGRMSLPVEYFHYPDGTALWNSPRNQAQCQLALTMYLFEQHFGVTPEIGYVFHLNDDGARPYELRADLMKYRKELYIHLQDMLMIEKHMKISKQIQLQNQRHRPPPPSSSSYKTKKQRRYTRRH